VYGRRLTAAVVMVGTLAAGSALGRSAAVLSYPVAEVWSTAVRFVRVDRGYTVREKDEESGYILFDLVEGTKTYKASLELIRVADDQGREATRAVFAIPDLPRHYETVLLDKLEAKVREERGVPAPPPPPRKPAAERADAGPPRSGP
jgi:hypothetical protein